MKKIFYSPVFIFGLLLSACSTTKNMSLTPVQSSYLTINGKLFATVFQQRAAEYRALYYQALNAARMQVINYKAPDSRPLAIITDVDETILDNSTYAVHRGMQGKDYEPASWFTYTDMSSADTLPGTATFLKFAHERGIEIFYVTNRELREQQSTITNLQKYGLPNADLAHMLVKTTTSSKEKRRIDIAATHNIVLLMGDNLADFSSFFEKKTTDERRENTDKMAADFGSRFILFPNTTYGDWESALYNYKYDYTMPQKDSIFKSQLKGY
ncbi:MAG: 5'-nucleotidase, lipoprotein e(P4) family [Ferruginibacter sp.]